MAQHAGTSRTPGTVVIAAGGTGGHIQPGLALAEAITALAPGTDLAFTGTPVGMESELVPKEGHPLHLYDMTQFAGRGWRKALVPLALLRASLQARSILKRTGASVAVSMGGYSGVPLVIGAKLARVPAIIHEPGAVPGKANLLAARFTSNVAASFPSTRFPGREVRQTGYPLRQAITTFDRDALRPEARAAHGLGDGDAMILVSGGSQGSVRLNELALGLAARWADRTDVRILLKAGARNHEATAAALDAHPGRERIELVRYIDSMPHAYAAADLAITRSGAATVTELAVVELPAVLVPFPHDEHDEQLHNAEPLVAAGGALLVRDADATPEVVGPLLEARIADRAMLDAMRTGMRESVNRDAARDLARWVLELAAS